MPMTILKPQEDSTIFVRISAGIVTYDSTIYFYVVVRSYSMELTEESSDSQNQEIICSFNESQQNREMHNPHELLLLFVE
jgi:hypothetical protein